MEKYLSTFLCTKIVGFFLAASIYAQPANLNLLKEKIDHFKHLKNYFEDTAYLSTVNKLAFVYADNYPDSAILLLNGQAERCRALSFLQGEVMAYKILGNAFQTKGNFKKSLDYYRQSYQLAKKNGYKNALPGIQNNIGLIYLNQGNYSPALREFYSALKDAEVNNDQFVVGSILNNIATIHFFQEKLAEAEMDYRKMLKISESMSDTVGVVTAYNNIGEIELERNNPRGALQNLQIASRLASIINDPEMLVASSKTLGYVYLQLDSLAIAATFFNKAIALSKQQGNTIANSKALIGLAKVDNKSGRLKEALANALEALQLAEKMGQTQLLRDANEIVSTVYENLGQGNKALHYYRRFKIYADSIRNIQSERAALTYKADYTFSKKELEYQRKSLQQQWLIFSAFAALTTICVITWLINRNRRKLDHKNKLLQQKNLAIEAEKSNAENALQKLRVTQSQLIQAEKMASLGELTAGIAHEIQNPLNFVNNFSDVSNELIDELRSERLKADTERDEEMEAELLNDLQQNLEKINQHGKRADAIVKSMLQHSQSSKGQKEPTDMNALCEEYLHLSYHGFRTKDKSFQVDSNTGFDETLEKLNIVPQEIGRVLLNLFNNAFYAVCEKKKQATDTFLPIVKVSTEKLNGMVEISIEDNGNGIPHHIIDKVFQPFFTTKPAGQGLGLGLSLAYDIIKAHGGEIKVQTKDGIGTRFIVLLPV